MKIGFIGLGLMGTPMAMRLLKAGYPVSLFSRTQAKGERLIADGAVWCSTPRALAEESDLVFSMVSDAKALRNIAVEENGILSAINKQIIHVDCSTVDAETTRFLDQEYRRRKSHFIHAPVLGSVPQAMDGTLLIFAGGSDDAYQKAESCLRVLSKQIWRFEKPEHATVVKIACNAMIAGMFVTLAQSMVMLSKAGVDNQIFLDILSHSQLNSQMFQTKGNAALDRNFAPRFFLGHMLKDVRLMVHTGELLKIPAPVANTLQPWFEEAVNMGLGKEDYSSVLKVLEKHASTIIQRRSE